MGHVIRERKLARSPTSLSVLHDDDPLIRVSVGRVEFFQEVRRHVTISSPCLPYKPFSRRHLDLDAAFLTFLGEDLEDGRILVLVLDLAAALFDADLRVPRERAVPPERDVLAAPVF